jgi:phosphate transport system permease protein
MSNPFTASGSKHRADSAVVQGMRLAAYIILGITAAIFLHIILRGAPVVFNKGGWKFLSELPETLHVLQDNEGAVYETSPAGADALKQSLGHRLRDEKTVSYSGGGIWGPIVGTVLLVLVSIFVALVLGIGSAIYLSEYARRGKFIESIRLAILNLAGVPSIVFGLFGVGVFVLAAPRFTGAPLDRSFLSIPLGFTWLSFEGWDTSVLAGGCTLAFVILPVIITASEECLRAVPQGFRETSLALGATRWQTIRRCVLPFAMPGILTSSVLGIARAAGETAPIMFTAAIAYKDKLPWNSGSGWWGVFTESVQALPYHIYTLAARIPQNEYSARAQYGSVFVFLVIVMGLAMSSILLRRKLRAKYQW